MSRHARPDPRPSLSIANCYLQGELPAQNAATQLRGLGPFGKLLAGEVLLEQATVDAPYMVSTHALTARRDYEGVISQTKSGEWRDGYDHVGSRGRARMRLAQLETLKSMYHTRTLPPQPLVEKMYNKLLKYAVGIADMLRSSQAYRVQSANELRGVLGEFAVLLLAQRYAIREVGCEEWLPLQSSFREDNAGNCLIDNGEYAWDLNIFTPSGGNDTLPNKTYSLQIKTYNDGDSPPPVGPTVYIHPDLAIMPTERWVAEKIIASCQYEAQLSAGTARLTEELDTRTEKLLDILEQPA